MRSTQGMQLAIRLACLALFVAVFAAAHRQRVAQGRRARQLAEAGGEGGEGGVQAAIVGGAKAAKGRYPYLVSLRRNVPGHPHFCGATLIAPRILLSAAHCFWDAAKANSSDASVKLPQARIGGYESRGGKYEARQVVDMLTPAAYNPRTQQFDVAVLLLNKPSAASPVKLAAGNRKAEPPLKEWQQVYSAGWGRLAHAGALPTVLQEVALGYVPRANCSKQLPQVTKYRSMICAGSPLGGRNTCSGDSGGPLLRKGRRMQGDIQIGVVSFGFSCSGKLGVYSSVPYLKFWIRQAVIPGAARPARAAAALRSARRLAAAPPAPPPAMDELKAKLGGLLGRGHHAERERPLDESQLAAAADPRAMPGRRLYQEDRHTLIPDFSLPGPSKAGVPCQFMAVYDGHASHKGSEHASRRLHDYIAAQPAVQACTGESCDEQKVEAALTAAFEGADEEIVGKAIERGDRYGTTAVCALRIGSALYAAHAGDSRAVLCRDGHAVSLTRDHKPASVPEERRRIEAKGGQIVYEADRVVSNPEGVRHSRLNMSRALGDPDFKEPRRLVEAAPDVARVELRPGSDTFVLLGSDGLFDVMEPQQAVDLALQALVGQPSEASAEAAAGVLVQEALRKGSSDNVTAALLLLDWQRAAA
ncbi:phosphatase 2C 24 [Micractinium conductrix]|uniref:protein-serine/threonine phosphatase n=1 Tax=Micractinium conductrix TaxID=554055 RepID=A0A2P6V1B3_9CHLO|nr:phosphatase 2C 24 [Micractinium conductrix]|eukprot:PSC67886.1 phosphatase 2C 24 [Micractinium conductrix]